MSRLPLAESRASFVHALDDAQLGQQHDSLASFREATNFTPRRRKEYAAIVVTSGRRVFLGMKHRGLGKGMFDFFGGKLERHEHADAAAQRELQEKSGIEVQLQAISNSKVGIFYVTFEDETHENVVHAYHVEIATDAAATESSFHTNASSLKGCDEITPQWFDDYSQVPLNNMFADISVWLPFLLASGQRRCMDGWFHFLAGGEETNTVLHHHIQTRSTPSQEPAKQGLTLEKRLFHALHDKRIVTPTAKEFNEAWAFVNAVRAVIPRNDLDVVIDVAGGHGALAALFLVTTSAQKAVVVDPADVGRDSVRKAWQHDFFPDASLEYRYECLRTGLPTELELALQSTAPKRVLVVGCHACQHLSDETVEISCQYGVHVCVLPCCQKDPTPGMTWKNLSKNINVPIAKTMDLLLAGKAMGWTSRGDGDSAGYDVRMKTIDAKITPQNRVIVCKALGSSARHHDSVGARNAAHQRLERAYKRAHVPKDRARRTWQVPVGCFVSGVVVGCLVTAVVAWRPRRK